MTTGTSTDAPTQSSVPDSDADSGTTSPVCNMNDVCDLGESPALCPDECDECGNGVIDASEACDDGTDNSPDDAYFDGPAADAPCNSSCAGKVPHCGDTVCQEDDEDSLSCPEDGCLASCGNGVVEDGEECDDDNDVNTDVCLNSCKEAICGDGVVRDGVEACDDANGSNSDSCTGACEQAVCGDGFTWSGVEDCDDANDVETDDCDATCATVIHRKVFTSSNSYNGALGGLSGADGQCQMLARGGGLAGTFKAWLSDGSSGPLNRFDTAFTGVYELVDGTTVAHGWMDLTDGALEHAIDTNENGGPYGGAAWTNTLADGSIQSLGGHCSGWTSTTGSTTVGDPSAIDNTWTDGFSTQNCTAQFILYCFEDI